MTVTGTPPSTDVATAERLRTATAGVRLSISWLGVRRTLTRAQKSRAAEPFDAAGEYVAASKKLLDTSHPAFKTVTAVRGRAVALWKALTLPFPEPGVRLIRHADIADFDQRMTAFGAELAAAVAQLDARYDELRAAARGRLGQLYDPADYPARLRDEFALAWDYPSVEPPAYLRRLAPELYERECRRVAGQFDAAVELAEQAFLTEFGELVAHLAERLSGRRDGRPKVFRDSAVDNLHEFFGRFRRLNIGSSDELERLVADAQGLLRGVAPTKLRDSASLRREIGGALNRMGAELDQLLADRPRRAVMRRAP